MTDIFKEIKLVDELPTDKDLIMKINDIFPYIMEPYYELKGYDKFLNNIITLFKEYYKQYPKEDFNEKKSPNQIISNNIKTIYTKITYPLTNPAYFKFVCNEPVTCGMLLYAYTVAYQKVYEIEENDDCDPELISGMLNRATSNGRFGIWGHCIKDLVYNGISEIKIYDDHVICYFDCDS